MNESLPPTFTNDRFRCIAGVHKETIFKSEILKMLSSLFPDHFVAV